MHGEIVGFAVRLSDTAKSRPPRITISLQSVPVKVSKWNRKMIMYAN